MKSNPSTFPAVFGAIVAAMALQLQAQTLPSATQVRIEVGKAVAELQTTPEYEFSGASKKKVPRKREWMEIEIPFKTKSDSPIKMVDELTFVYYLAVQGAAPVILTDSFNYTNIPDDEEMYTIVYISPTALARLAGGGKFDSGSVKSVGVEVLHKGRVIHPTDPREAWWNDPRFATMARQNGMILPKEKTPFSLLWADRHVELQQAQR